MILVCALYRAQVAYVHSLGLKFGLYGDRGTMDCGRAPGQQGHEHHDGLWLGRNKIDWFKSDSCYTYDRAVPGDQGHIDAIILYEKMRAGFNKSGYPVWRGDANSRPAPLTFSTTIQPPYSLLKMGNPL